MKRNIYLLIPVLMCFHSEAQESFKGQVTHEKTYELKDIYDSTYGIQLFDKFNVALGGDSVRKTSQGYVCNGFVQDHYTNGALLHKGFYADGQLTLYTNYYPDGQVERTYKAVTERKNELKKYFPNGKQKSIVEIFDGVIISYHDFYDDGTPSYVEEYDKKHEKLLQRCSYYPNGKPESLFVPIEKTPNRYSHKEYFEDGVQVKEEYEMVYSKDAMDFIKQGEDKVYDEKGNLVSDIEYVDGQENRTIK